MGMVLRLCLARIPTSRVAGNTCIGSVNNFNGINTCKCLKDVSILSVFSRLRDRSLLSTRPLIAYQALFYDE